MVGLFPGIPYSFGALRQTYGPLFVRCDVCRRYARLYLAEIRDTDSRAKTFSCCRCGTDGALAITEPNTETGMTDYQLDQVEGPQLTLPLSIGSPARARLLIVCQRSTMG